MAAEHVNVPYSIESRVQHFTFSDKHASSNYYTVGSTKWINNNFLLVYKESKESMVISFKVRDLETSNLKFPLILLMTVTWDPGVEDLIIRFKF